MKYTDEQLKLSLEKGFINYQTAAHDSLKPQLLTNRVVGGETVLTTLLEDLQVCQSFFFSVAFITESGLATLKAILHDLHMKGVSGKILTSTFLEFNNPKVFQELLKIPNVEVRLTSLKGFHAKGYMFEHPHSYSMIVGSSNLTANALKVNYEWNIRLTSNENGELIRHFLHQFEEVWNEAAPLSEEWIANYAIHYKETKERQKLISVLESPGDYVTNPVGTAIKIKPNKMQSKALENLAIMRSQHQRALVVSATGTGKTYLSAFDVRAAAPKRMLFIVHREQILNQAKADFQRVLGAPDEQFGFLTGGQKDIQAKYVFATIQTLSKLETLRQIPRDHFDYVIVDEVHRAGAGTYQRVIDHFTPDFLLGMTATPERTDQWNIFELFDYNVAYEIRLQEALEEDLLSTFHYFGVTDIKLNGQLLDDEVTFNELISDLRIDHIIEKITYYGYAGERVRGLMFCSRKDEAHELSKELNKRGFKTKALTGEDSMDVRLQTVDELENGELEYIITVDIFNEGIDIPSINQVVMLRQTQSSIIFIQQLGRGLRKHASKEFVTIIDFIGNYKNNYLIPMALSGDSSLNKDTIRRSVSDTSYIKGASTVLFEQVAKEQIYRSINSARIDNFKYLKETFLALYNRLGREPNLLDFVENHSIDPVTIMESNAHYDAFVNRINRETLPYSNHEVGMLTFLSQELLAGKRLHEIVILKHLLLSTTLSSDEIIQLITESGLNDNERSINSALKILNHSFFTAETKRKYMHLPPIEFQNGKYSLSFTWLKSLKNNPYFAHRVQDILTVATLKSEAFDAKNLFTLYKKYSRRDVAKLLNWDEGDSVTMYGYQFKHSSMPIFVNYHKQTDTIETLQYGDNFIDDQHFKWYTRVNFKLDSPSVLRFLEAFKEGMRPHLFVKKDNIEGKDFYYLGEVTIDFSSLQQEIMPDKYGELKPVVTMIFKLQQPVEFNLYHYLTHD